MHGSCAMSSQTRPHVKTSKTHAVHTRRPRVASAWRLQGLGQIWTLKMAGKRAVHPRMKNARVGQTSAQRLRPWANTVKSAVIKNHVRASSATNVNNLGGFIECVRWNWFSLARIRRLNWITREFRFAMHSCRNLVRRCTRVKRDDKLPREQARVRRLSSSKSTLSDAHDKGRRESGSLKGTLDTTPHSETLRQRAADWFLLSASLVDAAIRTAASPANSQGRPDCRTSWQPEEEDEEEAENEGAKARKKQRKTRMMRRTPTSHSWGSLSSVPPSGIPSHRRSLESWCRRLWASQRHKGPSTVAPTARRQRGPLCQRIYKGGSR